MFPEISLSGSRQVRPIRTSSLAGMAALPGGGFSVTGIIPSPPTYGKKNLTL